MKEELWLKQIKERLDNYVEPVPLSGWERLEKELPSGSRPAVPKVVPFYRRWSVAAAAALLLAVSSVSIWLMQSPLRQEIQQAVALSEIAVSEPVSVPTYLSADTDAGIEVSSHKEVAAEKFHLAHAEASVGKEAVIVTDTVARSEEVAVKEAPAEKNESAGKKEERTVRYRPSSRDKYHLPPAAKASQDKGWSFALAVGNTGGFSSLENSATPTLQQSAGSVLSSDGMFDLSATAQDIFYIPAGQNLVFNEGIPMLKGASRQVVSVDHHQPISVGFSVRKMLSHGLSLETGLQYTYLASDVVLRSGEELNQKLHYIGIPLRANWSFLRKDRFELYVSAGGAVEKCIYGKIGSETHTVKPLQLSVLGAIGAQLNLSRKVGLYVEPGVSYFFDDGSRVATIRKENPCNFTLQGGIRFTY